jgi:hypothetical protein
MSVTLSCPACNTAFELPEVPPDRRATCPRCRDAFPVRGEPAEHPAHAPAAKLASPAPKRGFPLGVIALVGAVFVAIVVGAGAYAYFSLGRGSKQDKFPDPEPTATVTATPPAKLSGLGYLPAECNVVFAVQPGPLLDYAARAKREPRELIPQLNIPAQLFGTFETAGITLPMIDHIAVGLFLPSGKEDVRAALVLVLKQPLENEEAFLHKGLKAQPAPKHKDRYAVTLEKIPLLTEVARVSPTVWVFGLSPGDFVAVERDGFGPGGTQFRGSESEGLRKMIAAVPATAGVWVVADDDSDWGEKPLAKLVGGQSAEAKKWVSVARGGRGGMLALSFGEQPQIKALVRTTDATAAERVSKYFQARAAEKPGAKAGPSEGPTAQFEGPFDPALLQRFIADAAK